MVTIVLCTILPKNQVKAQTSSAPTQAPTSLYGWGLASGISVNNFTYESPHTGINLGYTANGFVDRTIGKNLKLRLTVGYTQAGGTLTTFKDDTRYGFDPMFTFKNTKESSFLLYSIDTWLSMFYEKKTAQNWSYYAGIGGGMANKMGEYEKYEKTGEFVTGVYGTVENKQFTNRFQRNWFNSNITAGIQLPTKKFNLFVEARYILGITSVRPNYSYIEFDGVESEIRTNAFQLTVGARNMFGPNFLKLKKQTK